MEKTNEFLEKEPLGLLMRKYAIPCVIALLVAALYNIVDQIFIANAAYLGSNGNAANTVVYPLTVIALAVAMMLGDGCCAFVSINLGAKRAEDAHRGVGTTAVSVLAAGIVLTAIYLIFQDTALTIFGAQVNEDTFALSKEYFFWITLGIPFYMFAQAMSPVIRSDGSPRYAMAVLLTGAVLNIVLDPICIYVLRWGMTGAALATIFGQIVSAILSAVYLTKMKAVKLSRDSFRPRWGILKRVAPMGTASLLSQISVVLSIAAVLNMLKTYGAADPVFGQAEYSQIPTAVMGIVSKFYQIVVSIAVGLACGCMPVFGYNLGAGRHDRVRALERLLLITELIVGAVFTAVFLIFPVPMINLFGAENESPYYTEFAVRSIWAFLCALPLTCLNKGVFIFMEALGKSKESTLLSMLREVGFGAGLPLVMPLLFGLYGILWFNPLADLLALIPSVILLRRTHRDLDKNAPAETVLRELASPAGI